MKYEYLAFNLLIFTGPILGGLIYPKTKWPKLRHLGFSIIPPALLFIIADFWATGTFWYFNAKYISGVKLYNLPFEEVLFFFTVPFACLFLWVNWPRKCRLVFDHRWLIFGGLGLVVIGLASFVTGLYYSALMFSLFGGWLIVNGLFLHPLLNRYDYLTFMIMVLFLTTIFNGYLTARPVVLYNPQFKTNVDLFTIPIEDIIYGFILINLNLWLYHQASQTTPSSQLKP